MTALEIVANAYPGIPIDVLKAFENLLPAEASYIDPTFPSAFIDAWKTRRTYYSFTLRYSDFWGGRNPNADRYTRMSEATTFNNPQNPQFIKSVKIPIAFSAPISVMRLTVPPYWTPTPPSPIITVTGELQITYDTRLCGDIIASVLKTFFVGVYPDSGGTNWFFAMTTAQCAARGAPIDYKGAESILALYECGIIIPEVDYAAMYTLNTYLNAYKKFSTQIEAEKQLLKNESTAALSAYQQDYDDRANREFAALQAQKIQLLLALDNEQKSAMRDYQNMLLNAQTLKATLGGSIG